jgi:hypothetical protein
MRSAMILVSVLLLGACNLSANAEGRDGGGEAGPAARRDFQVGGFERISLAGSHNVIVQVGGAPSVRAEGDAKLIERLEITVEGGELRIGSKESFSFGFKGHRKPLTIHVTAPSLTAANLSGSGDLRIDKVEGERFAGAISGSGDIDVAALKVGQADFSISGSGRIRAVGTAQSSNAAIAGSGDLDLAQFEVRTTKVDIAGSGDVQTRAMESADISIMGSGDVTVSGPAKCNVSKMGGGDVRCAG